MSGILDICIVKGLVYVVCQWSVLVSLLVSHPLSEVVVDDRRARLL